MRGFFALYVLLVVPVQCNIMHFCGVRKTFLTLVRNIIITEVVQICYKCHRFDVTNHTPAFLHFIAA